MKAVGFMAGPCLASWLLIAAIVGYPAGIDVLFGMAGPLAVACGTWILMERTYRSNPQGLTSVMMGAFAGKLVFFGAYVVVMMRAVAVQPTIFVASFTGYFIALYGIEALLLKRLMAGGRPT